MSLNSNGTVRCDSCGRLSNNKIGEYTRADGSAGYINCQGDQDSVLDFCDDCMKGRRPNSDNDYPGLPLDMEGDCPTCDGTGEVCCNCDDLGCRQCIDGQRTCSECGGSGYREDDNHEDY